MATSGIIDPRDFGCNTIEEVCKAHGISEVTFRKRIKAGDSVEEALRPSEYKQYLNINAKDYGYRNIEEMCKAHKVSIKTFRKKILNGETVEQALSKKGFIVNPEEYGYKSIIQMCNAYGIEVDTFRNRLNSGRSVEEALTDKRRLKTLRIDTKKYGYKNITEMCKECGVSMEKLKRDLENGMRLEDILGIGDSKVASICQRYGFKTIIEMCNYLGEEYRSTKAYRLRHYWDIIPALICKYNEVSFWFVTLDGRSMYKASWSDSPITSLDIIRYYRSELEGLYRKGNPNDKWQPLM